MTNDKQPTPPHPAYRILPYPTLPHTPPRHATHPTHPSGCGWQSRISASTATSSISAWSRRAWGRQGEQSTVIKELAVSTILRCVNTDSGLHRHVPNLGLVPPSLLERRGKRC